MAAGLKLWAFKDRMRLKGTATAAVFAMNVRLGRIIRHVFQGRKLAVALMTQSRGGVFWPTQTARCQCIVTVVKAGQHPFL